MVVCEPTGGPSVAVLCVDMQNDFVLPGGKLFVQEAPACVPHCQRLIDGAREKGAPVFWIIREHDSSGATTRLSLATMAERKAPAVEPNRQSSCSM
jgi:nicotinamidase-related amidase